MNVNNNNNNNSPINNNEEPNILQYPEEDLEYSENMKIPDSNKNNNNNNNNNYNINNNNNNDNDKKNNNNNNNDNNSVGLPKVRKRGNSGSGGSSDRKNNKDKSKDKDKGKSKEIKVDEDESEKIEEEEEIKRLKVYYRKLLFSKILENKGSVARDHLANERTFLAWLRTSLGSIGLGVALAKLGSSEVGGIIFVALGSLILIYSPFRYFQVYRQLIKGKFSPNFWGTVVFVILSIASAIAALIIVLTRNKN